LTTQKIGTILFMTAITSISVIIPSYHSKRDLIEIVDKVCCQTAKPAEIVIVDSSPKGGVCPSEIAALCSDSSIKLIYEHRERALPGEARNIGLGMANGELIAFIDVQTIPRSYWLATCLDHLDRHDVIGVFGAICFSSENAFERLVRDGFYGVRPLKTLPGAVFRREVFDKTGQFIDWIRAGEDTEWLLRLELHKIPIFQSSDPLADYVGLIGLDMNQLLKKWHRNYSAARDLPHFFPQKLLLWLILYPLLVLIAFKWNDLLANWRMDSPLYIGHATKIVAILPALLYIIVRGVLLPLQRGVSIWQILPIRFLAITLICTMADGVKFLVFSLPKRKHNTIQNNIPVKTEPFEFK
jgi:GT2 family glycosyltransferase